MISAAAVTPRQLPGAIHAAEHAAIGLMPLIATCDRWDVGGVSTPMHPDTGLTTIFVYDGYPGGAGISERGYRHVERWLRGDPRDDPTVPVLGRLPVLRPVARSAGTGTSRSTSRRPRRCLAAILGRLGMTAGRSRRTAILPP